LIVIESRRRRYLERSITVAVNSAQASTIAATISIESPRLPPDSCFTFC
jgi:hypothetical protein